DETKRYRLVGPDEFNVKEGKISIDSPLARALLKKQVDDEVVIQTDKGEEVLCIDAIEYK
ncbi:MAG: transcription elongation factor GreB, partial [Cellvibrionaceae bacterium]